MPDLQSALAGAEFDGAIRIEETGLRGMITLRGDLAAAKLKKAASGIAGVDFPGQGEAACAEDRGILWMAPDEVLVLVPHADAADALGALEAKLAGTHFLAANVSDARAVFRLSGDGVREVLAKLTPADVSPGALAPGHVRRTRLAQVPAAFWLRGATTADLICFRSVAGYVFDLLCNAARPGSLPEHF